MYNIYIGETKVTETLYPCYVYWDEEIKSFRTCDEPQSEALYITQTIAEETASYFADIDYKEIRHEGFPIARIERDAE